MFDHRWFSLVDRRQQADWTPSLQPSLPMFREFRYRLHCYLYASQLKILLPNPYYTNVSVTRKATPASWSREWTARWPVISIAWPLWPQLLRRDRIGLSQHAHQARCVWGQLHTDRKAETSDP